MKGVFFIKIYKKKFFALIFIFLGSLLSLTIARFLAVKNVYIYTLITLIWFLFLSYREIYLERHFLATEWLKFKKKYFFLILLVTLLLFISIKLSRPFFNKFIPKTTLYSYMFSIETVIGLFLTF